VIYNDAMRILLKRPRWTASEMFVAAGVNTSKAVLRNLMYKFICRVDDSENEIIMFLSITKCTTMLTVPAVETLAQLVKSICSSFLLVVLYVFDFIVMCCTI